MFFYFRGVYYVYMPLLSNTADPIKKKLESDWSNLQEAHADLVDGMHPLGSGNFGIVVTTDEIDHADPAYVTKFMFRSSDPEQHTMRQNVAKTEINNLQILHNLSIPDIQLPTLITEPEELDSKDFTLTYSMTKIPGSPLLPWNPETTPQNAPDGFTDQIKNAGRALAAFHKAAAQIDPDGTKFAPPGWESTEHIETVSELNRSANTALMIADTYFQAHKKSGVVHGDYHSGNIITGENNEITGLIDFANTHYSHNIYEDFINIPEPFVDTFIEGYTEESGTEFHAAMIPLTHLALQTHWITQELDPERRQDALSNITENLGKISQITGYTPEL